MPIHIAGVDEVGRGPLAGPVVAACAVFEQGQSTELFDDSKKLSAKKRESLIETICEQAVDWAIVSVNAPLIDRINIREAAKLAMSLAVRHCTADEVLIDGNMLIDTSLPQQAIIKGDSLHGEISAASILAKVWRDGFLKELGAQFPGYGLEQHAGYPTKTHKEAVAQLGVTPIHRFSFRGVREHVSEEMLAETVRKEEVFLIRDTFTWDLGRAKCGSIPPLEGTPHHRPELAA
ncbi:MAG: ribonuclease HII [Bdellovibrionales bacterium]|nr:ribonuclease HII [Bdellovibrionales bacterium]